MSLSGGSGFAAVAADSAGTGEVGITFAPSVAEICKRCAIRGRQPLNVQPVCQLNCHGANCNLQTEKELAETKKRKSREISWVLPTVWRFRHSVDTECWDSADISVSKNALCRFDSDHDSGTCNPSRPWPFRDPGEEAAGFRRGVTNARSVRFRSLRLA